MEGLKDERKQDRPAIVAGIDAGMETTKAVVLSGNGRYEWAIVPGGTESTARIAQVALDQAAGKAEVSSKSIRNIVATGAGARLIPWAKGEQVESPCLSRGINLLLPSARTLLDLGARKSLTLRCEAGKVVKTAASGTCAAGTGTYLKMVSAILGIDQAEADRLYFRSHADLEIQSPCAVFAESEIISRVHGGEKIEDILRGVFRGLAGRIYSQLLDVGIEKDVAAVGGLARSKAIRSALEEVLHFGLLIPEVPEIVAALGAALFARDTARPGGKEVWRERVDGTGRPNPGNTESYSKAPPRGCPGGDGEPTQARAPAKRVAARRGVRRGDNKDGAKKATRYEKSRGGMS